MPILLLGAGFFILLKPLQSASLPFIILGIGCLGYGISELLLALRLMYFRHQQQKEYVEFEEVTEEAPEEEAPST